MIHTISQSNKTHKPELQIISQKSQLLLQRNFKMGNKRHQITRNYQKHSLPSEPPGDTPVETWQILTQQHQQLHSKVNILNVPTNPGLPHFRQILYQLSHKGSPRTPEWIAQPFSSGSSRPGNKTRVSCIVGRFFTTELSVKPMCHTGKKNTYQLEVRNFADELQRTLVFFTL